jgi:hypothetical protein
MTISTLSAAKLALATALPLVLFGCASNGTAPPQAASLDSGTASVPVLRGRLGQVVAMRRLTESQYRNSIADLFGSDIQVAGRFEPIVRRPHELQATGSSEATISAAGLEQFDALGRSIAAQVFSEANRDNYVTCKPAEAAKADAACARATLARMGRYLFRRPLTETEISSYVHSAGEVANRTGNFYTGLRLTLAAMLTSPHFLFVVERAESDPKVAGGLRLDNYSRAARLSFLLWDTAPTEALLTAAASGRLTNETQLAAIADHMVKSPRFEAGARAFFSDMLIFEKFDGLAKDAVIYPRFNQDVANALPEQMLRTIVDLLIVRQADYRELFTTRRTFMTRALGPLYGVPVRASAGWVPYEFGPNEDRAGILTLAGFLSPGEAQVGRSSPTLRGKAVKELLLCEPVPDPPGNVSFTAVQETGNKALPTARIRLGEHNNNPVCSGCHSLTDPIGLALEKFDGIGAFRETENAAPIDTHGTFGGVKFTNAAGLGKAIATSPSVTQCVTTRAFEYAMGRPANADAAQIEAIERLFAADGYRLPALFYRIATLPEAYRVTPMPLQSAPAKVALSAPATIRMGARK